MKKNVNWNKTEEILKKLETGVKDLFENPASNFNRYLDVMSKFCSYSVNNCILIMMQNPEATRVAGYNDWQKKFGRQVRKGEKGIKIISPAPYKKKVKKEILGKDGKPMKDVNGNVLTTEVEVRRMAFSTATVFDISQTDQIEGRQPLPEIAKELKGSVKNYTDLMEALKVVSPVSIEFVEIKGSAKGYFHLEENRIVIQAGMRQAQTLKTAIHECSHAILHNKERIKNLKLSATEKELQAEGIAYVVCARFGLDTGDYSFEYLASWSKDRNIKDLKEQLQVIKDTSDMLYGRINQQLQIIEETRVNIQEHIQKKWNLVPLLGEEGNERGNKIYRITA